MFAGKCALYFYQCDTSDNKAESSSVCRCYLTLSPASVAPKEKQPCSMHRAHAPACSFEHGRTLTLTLNAWYQKSAQAL